MYAWRPLRSGCKSDYPNEIYLVNGKNVFYANLKKHSRFIRGVTRLEFVISFKQCLFCCGLFVGEIDGGRQCLHSGMH